MNTTVPEAAPDNELYALFCGMVDAMAVQRIFQGIATMAHGKVTRLHLLFQSHGGFVGDGICLYNLFRALPFDLTLYNTGSISSIASIAFLGAKERKASAHASFMVHRTMLPMPAATAESLESAAHGLRMDDERTETIFRQHLRLSKEQWKKRLSHELYFSAAEAVAAGLATEIAEFSPPRGQRLFTV